MWSAGGRTGSLGGGLVRHLKNAAPEESKVIGIENILGDPNDLSGVFAQMNRVAAGTKSRRPFLHFVTSLPPGEMLTDEQLLDIALEHVRGLGMDPDKHQVAVVRHAEKDHLHIHVVLGLTDLETGKIHDPGLFAKKLKENNYALETRYGLSHNEPKEAKPGSVNKRFGRPHRLQQDRTGVDLLDVRAAVAGAWNGTRTAEEFRNALQEQGLELAQGDKRGYVIVDHTGNIHSAAKCVNDVKTKMLDARLSGIKDSLATVDDARDIAQVRLFNRLAAKLLEMEAKVTEEIEAAFQGPDVILEKPTANRTTFAENNFEFFNHEAMALGNR